MQRIHPFPCALCCKRPGALSPATNTAAGTLSLCFGARLRAPGGCRPPLLPASFKIEATGRKSLRLSCAYLIRAGATGAKPTPLVQTNSFGALVAVKPQPSPITYSSHPANITAAYLFETGLVTHSSRRALCERASHALPQEQCTNMLGAALWLPVWTEMCQDSGLPEGHSRSHTRLYGDSLDTCRLARQAQRTL